MERILLVAFIFITVIAPSILNIALLFLKPLKGKKKIIVFVLEAIYIVFGAYCTALASQDLYVTDEDWFEAIPFDAVHSPMLREAIPTFVALIALAYIGYILLKCININNMPPLLAVLCISAIYIGIGETVFWMIQTVKHGNSLMYIMPANLIIVFVRAIRDTVVQKIQSGATQNESDGIFKQILCNAKYWPWLAMVLSIPFLGIVVILLTLFGQRPDNVIRIWTETADWTLSTKIPPEPLPYDTHYLCTVAAKGHKKVVKPLRTGIRHGHKILVNRQLMIANAFEDLIHERTPRFHKAVRATYDKLGYPIAKHINSPYVSDIVYFIMKPLEWLFLIVLYLFDVKPENRIAVQYPHSKPPQIK